MERELYDIYNSSVKGSKTPFVGLSMFGSSPEIERDQTNLKLQNSVFSKIREIMGEDEKPKLPPNKTNDLKVYSVEDAIRELIELETPKS